MKFGSPFSAGWGSPENWLTEFSCEASFDKIRVYFIPILDGYYGIYRDSELQYMLYCTAGTPVTQWITADTDVSKQVIAVVRAGEIGINVKRPARWYDAQTSLRATLEWSYDYEVMGSVDTDALTQLGNWVLNGLTWDQLQPVTGSYCRGYLDVDIAVSTNDVTIVVSRAGSALCSGTAAFTSLGTDFTILLTEENSSGVSGSVLVKEDNPADGEETLYVRYPQYMQIIRDLTDPPTTVIKTIPFLGDVDTAYTETADLTPNVDYYYRTRPISDTGELGVVSDTTTVQCKGPPEPPTGLVYVSGNSADCVIDFTESTTPGVTYNFYIQDPTDDYINLNDPVADVTITTFGYQLPALSFPGTSILIVRAVKDGVEEENRYQLALEFDAAGNYVPARPNTPTIRSVTATSGLTISVKVGYDQARQIGVATHVHLYIKTPGGAYPAIPDGVANLTKDGGSYVATVTANAPATGWYFCKVFAVTAIEVEDSIGDEDMLYVSDTAVAAVIVDGVPTRG